MSHTQLPPSALVIIGLSLSVAWPVSAEPPGRALSELDSYPYAVGTQTFGARYQFTHQTRLVETAQAILDMGANVIKFGMGREQFANVPALDPQIRSLSALAADEPSYRRVLEMPFAHYVIWANPFSTRGFAADLSPEELDREYREMYAFAGYLLKTYAGTGKTFYLGHWEGDWLLLGHTDDRLDPAPERITSMIRWLNARQKAVDDAKRDVPHTGVQLYHYTEVNRVQRAMQGRPTLTNDVLPKTTVDFVSYSSYDSLGPDAQQKLPAALTYIESKLPAKSGIAGKRVFIGEYGYPAIRHSPQEQEALARQVMAAGLEWGCQFVLYWEVYNNEVTEQGQPRGFWLIDDHGVKQPVYFAHERFLKAARRVVADFRSRQKRLPTAREYWELARPLLDAPPTTRPAK